MSDCRGVSRRFLARLADGIFRSRLVDPIVSGRPGFLVIAAPSGYGKTVVAAQVAVASEALEILWIDSGGENGSVLVALQRLATEICEPGDSAESGAVSDVAAKVAGALRRIPDDRPLLVIFDDAGWLGDEESLWTVVSVLDEAPIGSSVVFTTREQPRRVNPLKDAWVIGPEQLLLDDAELLALWRRMSGDASAKQPDYLVEQSGRHAALAALVARERVLNPSTARPQDGDACSLIADLAARQLDDGAMRVLLFAAMIGRGSVESLVRASGDREAPGLMRQVSDILPLVELSGTDDQSTFAVHDLVLDALTPRLASSDCAPHLSRAIDVIVEQGDHARAVEVALRTGDSGMLRRALELAGTTLVNGGRHHLLRRGLGYLPHGDIATSSSLLLLRAQCLAAENVDPSEALRAAGLAVAVADEESPRAGLHARATCARLQLVGLGRSQSDQVVEDLLSSDADCYDSNVVAEVAAVRLIAAFLDGDGQGMASSQRAGSRLLRSESISTAERVRVQGAIAVANMVFTGEQLVARQAIEECLRYGDVSLRLAHLANLCSLSVHVGDRASLVRSIGDVMGLLEEVDVGPAERTHALSAARWHQTIVSFFDDEVHGWQDAVDMLSRLSSEGLERLSAVTALVDSVIAALWAGDVPTGRDMAERALGIAIASGSRILMWSAEMAQAMTSAASGDAGPAAGVAGRLLPQLEKAGARGLAHRARLVLAATALAEGRDDEAVAHIARTADYLCEQQPVFVTVAMLRAVPDLTGPLAAALGVGRIPIRILQYLPGQWGEACLAGASKMLASTEVDRLRRRLKAAAAERQAESAAALAASTPPDDSIAQVRLFGAFEVHCSEGKIEERSWTKRKARLIFAMLASRRGSDVPRDQLIEHLWPEMDDQRALNNFYVAWSAMKRALMPVPLREVPCPYVEHVGGICRAIAGRVSTDVSEFDDLLAAARKARAAGDVPAELESLLQAGELYRGDVMPGDAYDDWFASLRERCRHDFEDAMLRACDLLESRGDGRVGLGLVRRALEYDPWREDLYQAALRLQIGCGQRSAAIDTYMSCRSHLVDDLGIDPSSETTRLYTQVLAMED